MPSEKVDESLTAQARETLYYRTPCVSSDCNDRGQDDVAEGYICSNCRDRRIILAGLQAVRDAQAAESKDFRILRIKLLEAKLTEAEAQRARLREALKQAASDLAVAGRADLSRDLDELLADTEGK